MTVEQIWKQVLDLSEYAKSAEIHYISPKQQAEFLVLNEPEGNGLMYQHPGLGATKATKLRKNTVIVPTDYDEFETEDLPSLAGTVADYIDSMGVRLA